MRTHGDYAVCQLWHYAGTSREIVARGSVSVARFESVQHGGRTWGWLDLTFALNGAVLPVCGILVDPIVAARNDPSALIFPRAAAVAIDLARAGALTDVLLPYLRSLTRARVLPLEDVLQFEPNAVFDQARTAGELAAAPLAIALARLAPWVTAARIAGSGTIVAQAPGTALGAAVARRFGLTLTAVPALPEDPWYHVAGDTAHDDPDVHIGATFGSTGDAPIRIALAYDGTLPDDATLVTIPVPLPMEAVLTNDLGDAPEAGRFWIAAPRRIASPVARGPVQRRVFQKQLVLLVRDDIATAPDSDTDELGELALRARAIGVPVAFAGTRDIGAINGTMRAVACGSIDDAPFADMLATLAGRALPYAAMTTPAAGDSAPYEAALAAIARAQDDEQCEAACRALDALPAGAAPPNVPARNRSATALASAALLLPAITENSETVRKEYCLNRTLVLAAGAIIPPDEGDDDVTAICGRSPYVFAHAPAVARSGLLALAYALRDTGIPCVIATPPADLEYLTQIRRAAGPRTIVVTDAKAGALNALYRHATVFVDTSLRPRGASRVVRAARAGALPFVFGASWLAPLLPSDCVVPRASVAALRDTLVCAWQSPLLANRRVRVRDAFGSTLGKQQTVDEAAELVLAFLERFCA